jgi:hypothetical protein
LEAVLAEAERLRSVMPPLNDQLTAKVTELATLSNKPSATAAEVKKAVASVRSAALLIRSAEDENYAKTLLILTPYQRAQYVLNFMSPDVTGDDNPTGMRTPPERAEYERFMNEGRQLMSKREPALGELRSLLKQKANETQLEPLLERVSTERRAARAVRDRYEVRLLGVIQPGQATRFMLSFAQQYQSRWAALSNTKR